MKHEGPYIQVRKTCRHVKHRDYILVEIVGNGMDLVKEFGCGLAVGEAGCIWA